MNKTKKIISASLFVLLGACSTVFTPNSEITQGKQNTTNTTTKEIENNKNFYHFSQKDNDFICLNNRFIKEVSYGVCNDEKYGSGLCLTVKNESDQPAYVYASAYFRYSAVIKGEVIEGSTQYAYNVPVTIIAPKSQGNIVALPAIDEEILTSGRICINTVKTEEEKLKEDKDAEEYKKSHPEGFED